MHVAPAVHTHARGCSSLALADGSTPTRCTLEVFAHKHTAVGSTQVMLSHARGVAHAMDYCTPWPVLSLHRQGTCAGRGWFPHHSSSQPRRALGKTQAWQGSPGWLWGAALQLPVAFPSLTKVL